MNIRSLFLPFALLTLVSGCQTTSIQSAWYDTNFRGGPMRKIVVVGSVDSISDGRVFEDIFAEKLRAAGVDGVAGHTVIANDDRAGDAPFAAAVAKSGAQGLLLVRLLRVDTRTQVSTTMVSGGMGWGWGGGWGSPFGPSMIPVQQVSQYDLATVESKLFDAQTKQLVWAATTTTFNPTSVARETPRFADVIIAQLAQRGIIQNK